MSIRWFVMPTTTRSGAPARSLPAPAHQCGCRTVDRMRSTSGPADAFRDRGAWRGHRRHRAPARERYRAPFGGDRLLARRSLLAERDRHRRRKSLDEIRVRNARPHAYLRRSFRERFRVDTRLGEVRLCTRGDDAEERDQRGRGDRPSTLRHY